ncbi:helix-turn-helix domain-containing protein [Flavobacterium wongokense]|uniref:helix-turn-helix domain-containing protein n=1 Tax=Flavobacterium wongokense TaxID=2910674 RepID=UPI001F40E4D4|nr:helix-turn-helix domain-containing protein [Flavobacterium sp. WG47]
MSQIKDCVKNAIDLQSENKTTPKFSEYLSTQLRRDYAYLSSVFSDYEGITLEKFIIQQRINKVKEQLIQTDKSLTEISDEWGYSSVSHLSRQLKTYTGFDTYHFKNLRKNNLLSAAMHMA